ncbi:MAG: nucleotidyltransferase family protein [Candidatus Aenigmarchaeota archaeon]|nr:nucleotidyltransferase family protein [Candidatus Aenigmarchaeota archaeon]
MKIKTAIIIVGGKGLRLRPYTDNIPKCMIKIAEEPLLYWILEWLRNNGVEKVILGVDYKKEVIIEYIRQNDFGMKIVINDHTNAEGTGDAFRLAIENQCVDDEVFLAMNGDELTDVSLKNFLTFHNQYKPIATILLCPLKSPFGIVSVDSNHVVIEFQEKPILDEYFVNSGIYIFTQEIRKYLPEKGDIERTTFRELAIMRKLAAFKYFGFWNTINNIKELKDIEKNIDILKETRED